MSGAGRDPFEPPDIFDQSLIERCRCRRHSMPLGVDVAALYDHRHQCPHGNLVRLLLEAAQICSPALAARLNTLCILGPAGSRDVIG